MKPFKESNKLLNDSSKLRKQLRDDGYLFFRGILPKNEILQLRSQILEICQKAGWLRPRNDMMDALTDHDPIMERDEAYAPVYARVQALEAFHRLKFNKDIISLMETIFQEPVFPFPQTIGRIAFPNDNARSTPPHQDWIFVGGSTETISCWAPLGDIPLKIGGLKVLEGSHKSGFLEPRSASGPGGKTVDVDSSLEWVQSDYLSGDILLFKMLTIHSAAPNLTTDMIRLSTEFRYTGESHMIAEEWLEPHSPDNGPYLQEPLTWDILEKEWRDSPIAHYWERWDNLKIKKHEWFWEQCN